MLRLWPTTLTPIWNRRRVLASAAALTAVTGLVVFGVSSPASASGAACNPGCSSYVEFASYGESRACSPCCGEQDSDGASRSDSFRSWRVA